MRKFSRLGASSRSRSGPPGARLPAKSSAGPSCGKSFSFIGLLPAPDECISHFMRPYLKELIELKKLKRYRRVTLAGSRIFIRAVQQVNGWENKRYMFASSAVIPAS